MPFADLTDVRCHYEIVGNGDPLLMIAGLGCTCEKWSNITDELGRSFTLILADNRDMGQSVSKRMPQTLGDLVSDFVELLDHLQLERCHVLGLSLGGIIAQRLAIEHPQRVDRLVLVSCANRFGPYLREIANVLKHTLRRFPYEAFQKTVELLGTSPEYFDRHYDQIERALVAAKHSSELRSATARQLWCLGCQDVAPPDEYHIHAPTLVISAEQDFLIPGHCARQMAREIPGSEFLSIPGCGHNPLQERPGVVLPRIVEFLRRPQLAPSPETGWLRHTIDEVMQELEEVS